jgi:tryptophan halogenase
MGFRPEPAIATRRFDDCNRADAFFREAAALTGKMLAALPSNRELITHVRQRGLPRI